MGRVSRFWLILARVQMNQSLATLNASTQSGYSKSREQRAGWFSGNTCWAFRCSKSWVGVNQARKKNDYISMKCFVYIPSHVTTSCANKGHLLESKTKSWENFQVGLVMGPEPHRNCEHTGLTGWWLAGEHLMKGCGLFLLLNPRVVLNND